MEQVQINSDELETRPPAKKALKTGSIILLVIGGYIFANLILPALLFVGAFGIIRLSLPTEKSMTRVVMRNLDLLNAAVAETETLHRDVVEISTYQRADNWQRKELGDIRGMYARLENENGKDRYEALENDVFARVLRMRYVEAIRVWQGGLRLDCGAFGIIPSGAEYSVSYQPEWVDDLQNRSKFGAWPCEKHDEGWLVQYGGDDTLFIVPIADGWFYLKETW